MPFTPQQIVPLNGHSSRTHSIDHYYSKPIQILGPIPKSLCDLKKSSEFVLCPNCGKHVFTKVKSKYNSGISGVIVVLICLLFCLIGFWVCIPCVFLFPCTNKSRVIWHICPKCDEPIYQFNQNHSNGLEDWNAEFDL